MNRRAFVSSTLATISAATLGLFASRAAAKEVVPPAIPPTLPKASFHLRVGLLAIDRPISKQELRDLPVQTYMVEGSSERMVEKVMRDAAFLCAMAELDSKGSVEQLNARCHQILGRVKGGHLVS